MLITDLVYIDSTGYHFADYPTFLAFLQDEYRAIYGADVYLESDSQDGQFLAVLAKAFYDTAALGASVYNSFSPVTAQGVGLSRNVKINGIRRRSPSNSTADLLVVGQAGTVITAGIAQDALDQKWLLPPVVTIPGGGSITVTATAELVGDISAEANTIDRIFTPTLGWQTVNNPTAATVGAAVETDAELRVRQAQSTAIPSLTVLDGTIGSVANLDGVTKVKGYENDTDITDGNGIPPHSICIVTLGGDDVEIANAIALHKTPGTGTFGDTTETVYDAHGMPLDISFERPTQNIVKVQITLAAGTGWSSDFESLIQQAVADEINSIPIGDTILITKLFAPAYLIGTPPGSTFDIITLEIGFDGDPLGTVNLPQDFDEYAFCDADTDVTVIVT